MKVLSIGKKLEELATVSLVLKIRWPQVALLQSADGKKGLELIESESPHIVFMDIDLPDISGFEVLKHIRLFSDVPVILLTTSTDEMDKIRGLEMGADDYITIPFSPLWLLARMQAVLRRSGMRQGEEDSIPPFIADNLVIDFSTREVFVNDQQVHLTPTEYKLLYHLVRNEGRVVTHDSIKRYVWNNTEFVDCVTIKRHVHELRSKLFLIPSNNHPSILTERGIGYRFSKPANYDLQQT